MFYKHSNFISFFFFQNAIYVCPKLGFFHPAWRITSAFHGVLTRHTLQNPSAPQRCLDSSRLLSGSNLTESTLFILERPIRASLGLFSRDCRSKAKNTQGVKLTSLTQHEREQWAETKNRATICNLTWAWPKEEGFRKTRVTRDRRQSLRWVWKGSLTVNLPRFYRTESQQVAVGQDKTRQNKTRHWIGERVNWGLSGSRPCSRSHTLLVMCLHYIASRAYFETCACHRSRDCFIGERASFGTRPVVHEYFSSTWPRSDTSRNIK